MRVAVIGGTGYIGSAIVARLSARGDTPIVISRRPSADVGESRTADVANPTALAETVSDADAVIQAAAPTGDWAVDLAAIRELLRVLRDTGKTLIYTSGIWSLGAVVGETPADENAPTDPLPISSGRPEIERVVLEAADNAVRGLVIRPGIVYGNGGGIPSMLVDWAREAGRGRYVGDDPAVRWPVVHVDDLADLYLLLLDETSPDTLVHATSQPGVRVGDLAEAADRAAGGSGTSSSWPFAAAAEQLGEPFAQALVHDQLVESPVARAFGWRPEHQDVLASLVQEYAR